MQKSFSCCIRIGWSFKPKLYWKNIDENLSHPVCLVAPCLFVVTAPLNQSSRGIHENHSHAQPSRAVFGVISSLNRSSAEVEGYTVYENPYHLVFMV
jgi:hypothetical protein